MCFFLEDSRRRDGSLVCRGRKFREISATAAVGGRGRDFVSIPAVARRCGRGDGSSGIGGISGAAGDAVGEFGGLEGREDAMELAVAVTGRTVDRGVRSGGCGSTGFKRVTTSARGEACEAVSGAVWLRATEFGELMDPLRDASTIDRERIRALGDMWDKKETRGERLL